MKKNNFVSTNASSPPTKVTWKKGPNGYQKFKQISIPKNYLVSTIAPSSQAKVAWKKGPNGYQKCKQPEAASIEINQKAPEKQTRRTKNNSVSTTASPSAPTKVSWKGNKFNSNCKPIK